jgi:predicted MFS family arabinose efflux permease
MAYPLLVLALGGSAADAGLVGFAGSLPVLFFPLAGALMDRWNRKRVMIIADTGRILLVGSIPVALYFGFCTMSFIATVSFLETVLSLFYALGEPGALRNIVPPDQLGGALARVEARERGASLIGQPIGGFLFGLGRSVPFIADAISYVISLFTLLVIKKEFQSEEPKPAAERKSIWGDITAGLVWLWRQPFLRTTTLLVAGSNLLFQILVLLLIVKAEGMGASPTLIGIMLAGSGLGGLLGTFAAPWCEKHLPRKSVVIGVNWVWALLMPLIAVFDNLYILGGIFGLMAFVGPIWNVAIRVYQLSVTPDEYLGRIESAGGMLSSGSMPVGSLIGGFLLQFTGIQSTALVLAAVMILVAVAATVAPSIRNVKGNDEQEAEAPVVQPGASV